MIQVGEQAALGDATDEYLALVRAFPLVHIRDDAQYQAALAVMWPLVESSVRSDAQEAYLGALTDLIEIYDGQPSVGAGAIEWAAAPPKQSRSLLSRLFPRDK